MLGAALAVAFLALGASAPAVAQGAIADRGFKSENVARAEKMTFTVRPYAMAYASNPTGQTEFDAEDLPANTTLTLERMDGTEAIMIPSGTSRTNVSVWIDPSSVIGPDGWTLDQILRGVDEKKVANSDGSMSGGPFYLYARSAIIGCRSAGAVETLSHPGAEAEIGPNNFMATFIQYGCTDLPAGLKVKVMSAPAKVALVFPDPQNGEFWLVLRANVVDSTGQPIQPFVPMN